MDAKSTPAYFSEIHFLGLIVQLSDLYYRPDRGQLICLKICLKKVYNVDMSIPDLLGHHSFYTLIHFIGYSITECYYENQIICLVLFRKWLYYRTICQLDSFKPFEYKICTVFRSVTFIILSLVRQVV